MACFLVTGPMWVPLLHLLLESKSHGFLFLESSWCKAKSTHSSVSYIFVPSRMEKEVGWGQLALSYPQISLLTLEAVYFLGKVCCKQTLHGVEALE